MGSRSSKTKIEVPKPVVYQTRVPEEDFGRGEQVKRDTQSRIDELRETERYTVGNRKYRGYQDAVNAYMEAATYAASVPADQKSYAATYGAGGTGPSSKLVPAQTQTVEQSGFNPANYGDGPGIGMKDLTALRNQGFNKRSNCCLRWQSTGEGNCHWRTSRRFIRPDASTIKKRRCN